MKKILILIVASLMATNIVAQVSPQQQRDFSRSAYELLKTYAKASQMSDYRDKAQFFDLFESPDLQITNDLMGLNYDPTLSVGQYAKLLEDADMVNVALRDVKKEAETVDEDGRPVMTLSFLKRISLLSPCNTLFDSYDFFGRDYHMLMTVVYDPETGQCKIRELNSYGAKPEFPKDYRVLVQTDKRDKNLDINGKYFNFILGQKLLRPTDRIFYRGARVKEKEMKDQCDHKVFATYNDNSWRVRVNAGFSVSGFNKLGNSDGIDVNKNGETAFGLDFGYVFPTTSHLRFGIFAGVGLSLNNIHMSTNANDKDKDLTITTDEDVDGTEYNRVYAPQSGSSILIKQKMSATDLAIPVYADIEYEFTSIFSIYADAGLKFSLPMSHSIDMESSALKICGVYSDYNDLVIDKYINNFGEHGANYLTPDEKYLSAKTAIDAILGAGLRINITKSIAVDAGIQYQIGGTSWESKATQLLRYEITVPKIPADNTLDVGTDYANLMNKAKTLKHSALKANISLIFKF